MAQQVLQVEKVAVIGAGVSGVAAGIHLKRAGREVTVYERNARAGGIWIYDERIAKDSEYPSETPSVGDSPQYDNVARRFIHPRRRDSPMRCSQANYDDGRDREHDLRTIFAPPGPCYTVLKNNVSTIEMEMTCQDWAEGTEEFVTHNILADYIQSAAQSNDILECISFNTRVNRVKKVGSLWELEVARLVGEREELSVVDSVEHFDAVVVASGHYHAPNIPHIPGLADWKKAFPHRLSHSKRYRSSKGFENQNVLLIGAGVSSLDIAKDLGTTAASIYQSSRSGPYDLPSHLLPANAARVGGIESFGHLDSTELCGDGTIPGTVRLRSGQSLCGIHRVIVCTGYHVSLPFMREYHTDFVQPEDANETVLVTDGQQTHNLHKDIFYIPDPTLAFVGVPYHVATFTLFEFQAMALASVFSGGMKLPPTEAMRLEYRQRLKQKGAGRFFHSLKKRGDEIGYVNDLVAMVNERGNKLVVATKGHSQKWLDAYVRRGVRMEALFSTVRDPALDARVLERMYGC